MSYIFVYQHEINYLNCFNFLIRPFTNTTAAAGPACSSLFIYFCLFIEIYL